MSFQKISFYLFNFFFLIAVTKLLNGYSIATVTSGEYRPSDKGGRGGGGSGHPDPEIRGSGLQKNCFWPFGPHFGRKMREGS